MIRVYKDVLLAMIYTVVFKLLYDEKTEQVSKKNTGNIVNFFVLTWLKKKGKEYESHNLSALGNNFNIQTTDVGNLQRVS